MNIITQSCPSLNWYQILVSRIFGVGEGGRRCSIMFSSIVGLPIMDCTSTSNGISKSMWRPFYFKKNDQIVRKLGSYPLHHRHALITSSKHLACRYHFPCSQCSQSNYSSFHILQPCLCDLGVDIDGLLFNSGYCCVCWLPW